MRVRTAAVSLACLAAFSLAPAAPASTSFTGTSGLVFVPTATVEPLDHFSFGGVISDYQAFPAKQFGHFRDSPPNFFFAGYLTIGYLPRLEVTIRGSGMPGSIGPGGTGPFYTDGMLSAQFLAVRGGGRIPAVAVGLQDMYGFMLFNALYGVATWDVPVHGGRGVVQFTAGWAVDWYNKNNGTSDVNYAVNHVLHGPLLGVRYPLTRTVASLLEYDSRSFNVGLRYEPVRWCTIDVAAARWGLDQMARGRIRGFAAQLHFNGKL